MRDHLSECYSKRIDDKEVYFRPTENAKKLYARFVAMQACMIDASSELNMARRTSDKLCLTVSSVTLLEPALYGVEEMIDRLYTQLDECWDDWVSDNLENPEYFTRDGEE